MAATRRGQDMTFDTFRAAIDQDHELVTLGGGEPTIHPQFEKFLLYAISKCANVWMATNGSQTEIALALAGLAEHGVLGVALSQDPWHDPIAPEVVKAFTKKNDGLPYFDNGGSLHPIKPDDLREIRDVQGKVIRAGRANNAFAHKYGEALITDLCSCPEFIVKPDGSIRQCGCAKSPVIGDVFKGFEPIYNEFNEAKCYKKTKKSGKAA